MDRLVMEGGRRLTGAATISGSKNTALPLMAAALLADGKVSLENIPALRDISTFSRVIGVTGASIEHTQENGTLSIDPSSLIRPEAPYELVKRMRASFYMLGALLGRTGQARVSLPGGCAWGPRPVDLHIKGLEALGAEIELDQGYVVAKAPGGRLPGGTFELNPSSVGATINFLLAASRARGSSRLDNAATEPDVEVFCRMLEQMGARLSGIGTRTIEIEGSDQLHATSFSNCPDRIELGTFMIAAAIAGDPGSPLRFENADPTHLGEYFIDALRQTGTELELGKNFVEVTAPEKLLPVSIETGIYPGFPTDLQAQWTVLLACTDGNAKVNETIYQDRFKHIPELRRMGINAIVVGSEVAVEGGKPIQGAQVMSTDLRASVSLVLAGLVAEGETTVLRVYHLDRGYENLEGKFSGLGATIRREKYDEWADPA
ncbi:MAG: UDP-N-acetylglucosamine 1-carboxyvinyltransferase [Rhodothermia bacterium]|nr:MAG: UDP-N-acetylglucosamine 1-carboxyvinyltransferase [Rhodothermia bacterium]